MANLKISELSSATTLNGDETIPVVQSGANAKVTIAQAITELDLATQSGSEILENKTLRNTTEDTGALTGTTPTLEPGVWTWTLTGNSLPLDGLTNGQSCTLIFTPGANSITWPTSTSIGSWPTSLGAGVNVAVLFKAGGTLFRSYAGAA